MSNPFLDGGVIPAHPLALTSERKLDERRQRALTRYYAASGASGIAVGVHTTQFAIRDPRVGLYQPVLELAAQTAREAIRNSGRRLLLVAGIVGRTDSAVKEAVLARDLGFDAGLLSLSAFADASDDEMIEHCRAVGETVPLFGFYLQPLAGGRLLSRSFWRRFASLPSVVAIKVAPFNRYQTLDVARGIVESGRAGDIALFTGNDDHILLDLVTTYRLPEEGGEIRPVGFAGGLLGHWAVWTRRAVEQCEMARRIREGGFAVPADFLALANAVTDANAALFDPWNRFAGCIAGLHEVLRRQGLMAGIWCIDPNEGFSPGQSEEIDRVIRAYPELMDDEFVAEHRDRWLS